MNNAEDLIKSHQVDCSLSGTLRIGFLPYWSLNQLDLPIVRSFQKNYPAVKLYFETHSPRPLVRRLKENNLDVVLTPIREVKNDPELSYTSLGNYPFMVVLSVTHPLAKYDFILDKLDGVDLYTDDHEDRSGTLERLARRGIHSNIVYTPNVDSKIAAAENGLGYAVVVSCSSICTSPKVRAYRMGTNSTDVVAAYKRGNDDKLLSAFLSNITRLQSSAAEFASPLPGDEAM